MTVDEIKRFFESAYDEAAEPLGTQPYRLLHNTKQRCIEHAAVRLAREIIAQVEKAIRLP